MWSLVFRSGWGGCVEPSLPPEVPYFAEKNNYPTSQRYTTKQKQNGIIGSTFLTRPMFQGGLTRTLLTAEWYQ